MASKKPADIIMTVIATVITSLIITAILSMVHVNKQIAVMDSQMIQTNKYLENKIESFVTKDKNEIDKLKIRSEIQSVQLHCKQ